MIGLRRVGIGWWSVGLMAAGLGLPQESFADSVHLKSGKVIEGEILEATRSTVMLRANGSILPTSFSAIQQIVLTLADGSELAGELISWEDGVYEIRSANLLMRIEDGVIIEGDPEVVAAELEAEPTTSEPVAQEPVALEPVAAAPAIVEETAPSPVAMRGLPEFTLDNGQVVSGHIIHATGSIVTIRLHRGGVVPMSRAQIETIRFVGEGGTVLVGQFESWSDDVYQLKNGDQEILASLSDDAVEVGPPPALEEQAGASEPKEEQPAATTIISTDAAITPSSPEVQSEQEDSVVLPAEAETAATEVTASDDSPDDADQVGAGGPVNEAALVDNSETKAALMPVAVEQEKQIAAIRSGPHLLEPSVADVNEDSNEVVFEFRLNEPADRPLVILYAATDDTARAGEDFEAKSGVVTFNAGSQFAEVRIPLIDDEQSESSEQFHLFLSGDPETVQFSRRQIAATISDND